MRLYVASFGTDQILRFDGVTGAAVDVVINDDEGRLDCPEGLLMLPGRLLVASFLNDRVVSYSPDGAFQEIFAAGWHLRGPQVLLAQAGVDAVLVTSYHRNRVVTLDGTTGKKRPLEFGGPELSRPVGLAAAPGGELLCSSHRSNEILRYNASTGAFKGHFAAGHGLWAPTGIAMGPDLVLHVATFADGVRRYSFWR